MRTLFLCHRIPFPPDKGDKIRSYHLLTLLAKRGEVDLVTHVDDPRDLRHVQTLQESCRSVDAFPLNSVVGGARALAALPGNRPLSVAYMTRPAGARRVRELLGERSYDVVVGYSSQTAAYLPGDLSVPVVLDLVDVDSAKWDAYGKARQGGKRFISRLEARRVRALEADIVARCARVVVSTPREAGVLRDAVGYDGAAAIGNGVAVPDRVPDQESRRPHLAVFVGTMDYAPNEEAVTRVADTIWPAVRERFPEAVFRIVGRAPTVAVRRLAERPGIEVTGEVPDLSEHLSEASIALIPLRVARGIQNKVLEALAWGLPVVSTPAVLACLHADAAAAVTPRDDDQRLAAEVVKLFDDPALRQRQGERGREVVADHYQWTAVDAQWSALIDDVIRRRDP